MDCSLPGSSIHGIFQARELEWVAYILLHAYSVQFSSVQFSHSVMSDYLQPHESQHARPSCPSPSPGVYSNSCPWSQWCHPSSHPPLSPSPAPNPSQHQGLFQWVKSFHEVAKVMEFQLQYQSFQWTPKTDLLQDELVGSPCSPRDSQESSPTPQFKSSSSSVLSFLPSPTLTSIHDHYIVLNTVGLFRWLSDKIITCHCNKMWVQSLAWEDPLEEKNGNLLQHSCLENAMDGGAWWDIVHRLTKSRQNKWMTEHNTANITYCT